MTTDSKLPDLTKSLVDALDALFPEKSADPRWTDREVWIKSGERAVIRFIVSQYELQNERIL